MHEAQEADVHHLEDEAEGGAGRGGLEPGHLSNAGDDDAPDTFDEVLVDGVDVAVAVKDGDAKGLEDRATP